MTWQFNDVIYHKDQIVEVYIESVTHGHKLQSNHYTISFGKVSFLVKTTDRINPYDFFISGSSENPGANAHEENDETSNAR